jgi:uncharacterized protein YbjT (DUF2867 family)
VQERIVVTGGTGALGQVVVTRLLEAGHEVRVMSRRAAPSDHQSRRNWATADLLTGEGVAAAIREADVIIHCATGGSGTKEVTATRTLIEEARRSGCLHLVCVSVVGVDRVPLGYYRGKLAAERAIERSGVPYTILRATQFHDLLRVVFAGAAKLPVMFVPGWRFQPIDVRDVAARILELSVGDPVGRADDMGGPEVRAATDLARTYLTATDRRRLVVPVRLPGMTFRAYRQGGHLAPERAVGRTTFEQYLAGHPDPATTSYRGRQR